MNLQSTDFEIFDVPARFAQDPALLEARWKILQRQAHPDRFAGHGSAAQRLAMQWSVRINEAYDRLKDPIKRAGYLCELHGAPIDASSTTPMPTDFLMQQMQWREDLEEAKTADLKHKIVLQANECLHEQLSKCEQTLDHDNNYLEAAQQVRRLLFVQRFASEAQAQADSLGDAASV